MPVSVGDMDYARLFTEELGKLAVLEERREQLEDEICKHRQAASALFALMSEKEQQISQAAIADVSRSAQNLTQAVRRILARSRSEHITAVRIREELQRDGYDFSAYSSNPLVSVYGVLNRMKDDLEVTTDDDTKRYRLRHTFRPVR
jgi:hypothetical protein